MKNLKLLTNMFIFFAFVFGAKAQDYYYYKNKKINLKLNTQYAYIVTKDVSNQKALNTFLDIDKFEKDNTINTLSKSSLKFIKKNTYYFAEVKLKNQKSRKVNYQKSLTSLSENSNIVFVLPYYNNDSGKKMALSQYFNVKLKRQSDVELLKKFASKEGALIVGQNKFMPLWYTISMMPESRLNSLQLANRFHESKLFEHAEPSFVFELDHNAENSNKLKEMLDATLSADTYFNDQWTLKNTGQSGGTVGIDIRAESAWLSTKGSPAIKVAVFDEGYEMNHPDLKNNNYGTGYDTYSNSSPSVVWGAHGTACAGIVGATQDNNEGVSGVAPRTSLMSISIRFSSVTYNQLANGFNWAWQNGADIISNSWGGGTPSSILDNAINNALNNGRNGLGCVVVFSSGNGNVNGAEYPSNSNPRILCVGGIDRCGVRSGRIDIVPNSCDPWASNWQPGSSYGSPLDVVGGGTSVPSTDMQGTSGYNGYSNNNYTDWFGGTSAACPFVAGVAALVLAENSCLTNDQVEDIIEQTAQKVRTDLYSYTTTAGRPNGTWNNELGYGLVNAEAAVNLAQITPPLGTTAFDLYSKDRPNDIGTEPNNISTWFWGSQDMWVRQNLDGGTAHQNPEYKLNSPNGIYVRVRNRGNTTSSCAMVKVYFARASTGLVWPTNFINNYSGSLLNGDFIGSVAVPSIPPGGSAIVEIPWYPPNPADYGTGNQAHHFCLTSRIISANDPMYNEQNGVNINANAKNNNNIIWKNVNVYDVISNNLPYNNVYIRGVNKKIPFVNIRFTDRGLDKLDKIEIPFFEVGRVEVEVDKKLFRKMKENGTLDNEGIKVIDKNRVLISSNKAAFRKIPLEYGETHTLKFRFKSSRKTKRPILFDVVQENLETRELEGGERFLIVSNKDYYEGDKDEDEYENETPSIKVIPNPSKGLFKIRLKGIKKGFYILTDFKGNELFKDKFYNEDELSLDITKNKPGYYYIKVVSGKKRFTKILVKK